MNKLKLTGIIGLIAAITVGTGEFLLHFDSLARYSVTDYDFMDQISDHRLTVGHFFAVIGIPLYFIGIWHIGEMLRPAGEKLSTAFKFIGWFGFVYGAMWMSSRAMIGSMIKYPELIEGTNLVQLYQLRLETLLQVIRITTLIISGILIKMVLTGKTRYPKWMAATNPIVLLLMSFAIYKTVPSMGKYVMPIALNVAFTIFFALSLSFGNTSDDVQTSRDTSR